MEVKDTRWKLFRVMAMLMQATGRYQFGGGLKHHGFERERSWASESFKVSMSNCDDVESQLLLCLTGRMST